MASALPRPVQLKLDQTLAQWRHWKCGEPQSVAPKFERILGEGHSNYSVLVTGGNQYVVRLDGVQPMAHGINRHREWRTLQVAHSAGLSPRPVYFNPDLGSLVCEYLKPDKQGEQSPACIARLLRSIHALPACHARLDLRERILRYEKQLAQRAAALNETARGCRGAVLDCLERRSNAKSALVLCHNDLLRANRLSSDGRLWAIDWEYSAMGDPWYELAVVICGDELCASDANTLLESYLQRPPGADENRALLDYCAIYRYLELLWYLAQSHPAMDREREILAVQRLEKSVTAAAAWRRE
jgi:thiamine kinase-like enzyme